MAALLTKDHGVVRAAVKGARGSRKRAAALQILTEVKTTYFRREGADLARLSALEIVNSSFELASRAETAMLLPYLAESVVTFVPESEPGDEVYRLVRHVLDALLAGVPAPVATRYFEVWLLRFAGLVPEARECAVCGAPLGEADVRLDPEIPGFVSGSCARPGAFRIPASALRFLAEIRRRKLPDVAPPSKETDAAVEELTREIRRRFLGHELKSYRFLTSLTAT